ncbi:uncharacterized protein LOC125075959 [Vanessa atalanta]|uniref:uncharacterized protein LOC125075959 n=1 Tax=Vanessa atalanta TaxID=42275 RepID=UPI001FCD7AD8|nr:uncharacterized protein LOC125075959 [Vanessa atalanta]
MVIKANTDLQSEIEYNEFEVPKPIKRLHKNQHATNANHGNSCQKPTCTNNNEPSVSSNSQPLQRFNNSILTMELHHHPEETASHHSSVPYEEQNNFIAQPCTPSNQSRNLPKKRKLRGRRDRQCSKKTCANCEISENRLRYTEKKVETIRMTNELLRKNIFLLNRRSEQLCNILVATGLTEQ